MLETALNWINYQLKTSSLWLYLWKLWKLVQRRFLFGTHEIYRICTRPHPNSFQVAITSLLLKLGPSSASSLKLEELPPFDSVLVYRLDRSLMYSTQLRIERRQIEGGDCDNLQPILESILNKKFPLWATQPEKTRLKEALDILHTVNLFIYKMNIKASTKYDVTVKGHESKLYSIHFNLLNKPPSQRITKEWQLLGFQGNDPATDFRGMGKLALDELAHLSKSPIGKKTWNESGGDFGYSWAISGIQITAYQIHLLRSRKLQKLIYQWYFSYLQHEKEDTGTELAIEHLTLKYYDFYAWLFLEYHEKWLNFVDIKQEEYRINGQKFIPILLHNEFFELYKRSIENTLLTMHNNQHQQQKHEGFLQDD